MINQYYCSVKDILEQQKIEVANFLRHSDLNSDCMKILLRMVIERKDHAEKSLFKEQLDSDFQPHRMVSNIDWLEKYL